MFNKIQYRDLKAKQQENYNFAKVAAILADYGFTCLRLSDDWQGADFLAYHIDGVTTLKVQLKGRLQIDAKYVGKSIFIAFPDGGHWYLYPHDEVIDYFLANGRGGFFSARSISAKHQKFMEQYKIS
ncbi:MAG: hypothetical protein CVU31_13685 [Betaproteobacteria bacterium HGW-Betaproteobacteria-4]|jgi:hypothetical protein|nr:MAG: hypothetical protein CVU31_13685 [Betaproteobacteria bacterium HGW-Betaproteobacteria-4]